MIDPHLSSIFDSLREVSLHLPRARPPYTICSAYKKKGRRSGLSFKYLVLKAIPYLIWPWSSTVITVAKSLANLLVSLLTFTVPSNIAFTMVL